MARKVYRADYQNQNRFKDHLFLDHRLEGFHITLCVCKPLIADDLNKGIVTKGILSIDS